MYSALEARLVFDEHNNFCINYYVLEDDGFYGIKAEKVQNDSVVDESSVKYIFETKDEILDLIKTLADNTVTPFAMAEIIDELIS